MVILGGFPFSSAMAVAALFTKSAPMRVVSLVTSMTGTWRLCIGLTAIVAAVTGNLAMGMLEREVGDVVVKTFPVELDNIGITAFMLRMAHLAFGCLD